ncbi:adenosylmethionine decarboxylase [Candidatus Uhrbacteria bacterium]|nr:adenosylmethionine decarboxylase [Candidatus Uhrbacteria bacterium]
MLKSSPRTGVHILGELSGCVFNDDNLLFHDRFINILAPLIANNGLTVLDSAGHTFDDGGVTVIVALAESHVSVHTWPHDEYVTLDVFVCNHTKDNSGDAQVLFDKVSALFTPKTSSTHLILR